MKKRMLNIILILLISSCTISHQYYKTSPQMSALRNTMHSASYLGIIPRTTLLKISSKLNTKFKYTPNAKGYTYSYKEIDNLGYGILESNNNKDKKVFYVLHGGAFYSPLLDFYPKTFDYIVENTKVKPDVYMLDYSVYPDIFPKAHEEALKGYQMLLNKGYKPENIIVFGDSAGGHLAVSLMHMLRDKNIKLPKSLILFSPWLDIDNKVSTRITNRYSDILLGTLFMDEVIEPEVEDPFYFKGHDRNNPYVNPLKGNFKDFPKVYVQAEITEILYGDSQQLYEKVKKYNKDSKLETFKGMFHDFQIFSSKIPEIKEALDKVVIEINSTY